MKIFTGFFIACLTLILANKANSQITITQSDMPQANTVITVDSDLSPTVGPGNPGPSQTWNFTTLNNTKSSTNMFVNPGTTPYASSFPGANLADSVWGYTGYNYFSSQPGSFSIVGAMPFIGGYQVSVNFTPPYEQITLPAAYNTSFGGTSRGVTQTIAFHYLLYDSVKGSLVIIYADTMDAWGSAQLPSGNYSVLRQKKNETDIDSVFLHNSVTNTWSLYQANTQKVNRYIWYASGIHYPLVQMQMDTANLNAKSVTWYVIPSGINEAGNTVKTLVYPNPCGAQATFNCRANTDGYVTLFDITGRQVAQAILKNGTSVLNTSSLSKGMYLYRITGKTGTLTGLGKLSVQ